MAAIAALTLLQAPPAAPAPVQPTNLLWAVAAANADLATLPPERRVYARYLYAFDNGKSNWAAVSMALNTALSRSPFGVTPLDLHNGRLIRLDMSQLALSTEHATNLAQTYDSLAESEPYFHLLDWELVDKSTVFTDAQGEKHSGRWQRTSIIHPVLLDGYAKLIAETGSKAPLLVAEWFVIKSLSTIDGGRYYQFRGLRDQQGKALFKLNDYLRSRGADENAVQKLGSDERAAIIKSGVTAKPRRVDVFRGGGVRPSVGTGLVSITHDISDGQTKAQQDPIQNLLDFESAASEVILEVANGFHEFSLFDGNGNLVDEVPLNGDGAIAADATVPAPHTPRLNPAVSCIRCHGPHDGWQPFENDVQRLLRGGLFLLGDLAAGAKAITPETRVRLQGLYGGNLAEPLRLGRNTYADVVFRNTGGLTIPQASDAVAQVWTRTEYSLVSPAQACAELGIAVPDGIDPAKAFAAAVPPKPLGDELAQFLRLGQGIQRRQWERIHGDALARAIQSGAVK